MGSSLNSDKKSFNGEDFNIILNSLEYIFREKLKRLDSPIKTEIFTTLINKIPEYWIGIKYSSLSAKKKRNNLQK